MQVGDFHKVLEKHDMIAQKLFSASLIADVMPRLLEKSPSEGLERLNELRDLTRGAMEEMQDLLNELNVYRLNLDTVLGANGEVGHDNRGRSRAKQNTRPAGG